MDPSHCIAGLYFPWLAAFRPPKPSLGLCLDVRGYCSRRFHVQSFGHVFQVLIKLYDQNNLKHATADWESGGGDAHGRTLCNVVTLVCILLTLISSSC